MRNDVVSFKQVGESMSVSSGAVVFGYGSVVDTRVLRRAPIHVRTDVQPYARVRTYVCVAYTAHTTVYTQCSQ